VINLKTAKALRLEVPTCFQLTGAAIGKPSRARGE
jgi:hypothetical protein